jgi:hypothetical protein
MRIKKGRKVGLKKVYGMPRMPTGVQGIGGFTLQ